MPPPPVEIEKVHDGPETRAVDQVAGRAAEDHPDGDGGHAAALGQEARGHCREDAESADGEQCHDPAPARRHGAEHAERQARVHHEGQREKAVDDAQGGTGRQTAQRDPLRGLVEDQDDPAQRQHQPHRWASTTGRQRSQRPGCRASAPTFALHVQHRSHFFQPRA